MNGEVRRPFAIARCCPKATLHGFLRPQAISAIIFHLDTGAAQPQSPGDKRWASETVGGKGSRRTTSQGGSPSLRHNSPRAFGHVLISRIACSHPLARVVDVPLNFVGHPAEALERIP